jgi:hypothetical protein
MGAHSLKETMSEFLKENFRISKSNLSWIEKAENIVISLPERFLAGEGCYDVRGDSLLRNWRRSATPGRIRSSKSSSRRRA